jgi:hypothetical protein
MAKMSTEPAQLKGAPRCGAKTRGARGGRGGPLGEKNGAYKTGKYTQQTKELSRLMRDLAKTGEAMVAVAMRVAGLPVLKPIRRRAHVRKALSELKAKEKQQHEGKSQGAQPSRQDAPPTEKAEG